MPTPLYTFTVKSPQEIRDDILRTQRNGLIQRGVSNPNVSPNSDAYVKATAFANELAVVEANAVFKADELMPDTATEDSLDRQAEAVGLSRRIAAGSRGSIIFDTSAATVVSLGQQLIDGAGLRYQVTTGGTYSDGDLIPVAAIDLGEATNLAAGLALQWTSPPAYSAPEVVVDTAGFTNGHDAEDDETLRARIFARLATPPKSGNWEHIAELAEESHSSVAKCFVYPAIQGAGSVHAAVAGYTSATSKSREISAALVNATIGPYVTGKIPTHASLTLTTVDDVEVDVAIGLTLPSSPSASPPGPGGGWLDGTPWPSAPGSTAACTVTSVTSTTVFRVDALTAPTVGVTRIAWLRPTTDGSTADWKLYTAQVTALSGTSGAYTITLDTAFPGIATGCYIFPQSTNQQLYVDALLAWFAQLGPGEKTSNTSDLVRGYRHPTPQFLNPYSINATLLRALSNVGDEVLDSQFYYRSSTTPSLPSAVTDPPKIFIPRHIGFYSL